MTQLTRRKLFAGAAGAATALTPLMGRSALGSAPAAGKQAPGFYRYKVGDYEITQLSDGARTFPIPDGFIVNLDKDKTLAAAEAAYYPKDRSRSYSTRW